MPGYVAKGLQHFQHLTVLTRNQDSPHAWTRPDYGAKQQLTPPIDNRTVNPRNRRHHPLLRTRLRHDATLGSLASAQSAVTEKTLDAVIQLLNYAASHPMPKSTTKPATCCTSGATEMHTIYPSPTVAPASEDFSSSVITLKIPLIHLLHRIHLPLQMERPM